MTRDEATKQLAQLRRLRKELMSSSAKEVSITINVTPPVTIPFNVSSALRAYDDQIRRLEAVEAGDELPT